MTMKVYGLQLPEGQGLHGHNGMARTAGEGYIIPAVQVQALVRGQSINLHSA